MTFTKIDALYAGEMSAHHYFKDNYYADNGMIPMLLIFQIVSISPDLFLNIIGMKTALFILDAFPTKKGF